MPGSSAASSVRPLVSIILAVRNEAKFIKATVESLLKQDTEAFDLELLVIDGMSSDRTSEIVAQLMQSDPRVRLVINQRQKTPYAFNLGLREARGSYVCIFGAHTSYRRDYICVCLNELTKHGVVGCSGQIATQPADGSVGARLVAWCLSHWFGSSTRSVRTQPEGFCDTVPYPVMKKDALLMVGGYDEQLHRNQDNDMNQKLRARGYRFYLTGKTQCRYFVKPTVQSLLEYAFHTGYWNVISFRKNKAAMNVRHFVPFVFVIAFLCASAAWVAAPIAPNIHRQWLIAPFALVVLSHLLVGLLAGLQVSFRARSPVALLLPLVFIGFHLAYGLGTLWAVCRNARAEHAGVPQHIRNSHIL